MSSRRKKGGRWNQHCAAKLVIEGKVGCSDEQQQNSDDEFFSCVTSEIDDSPISSFDYEECSSRVSLGALESEPVYYLCDHKVALADANDLLKHAHDHSDDLTSYIDLINQLKSHMDTASGILRLRPDFEKELGTETSRGMLLLLAVTAFDAGLLEDAKMASKSLVHLYPDFKLSERVFTRIHQEDRLKQNTRNDSPVLKSCLKSKPSPPHDKTVTFSRTKQVRMFEKECESNHIDYVESEELPDDLIDPSLPKRSNTGWVPPSLRRKKLAEQNASTSQGEDVIKSTEIIENSTASGIRKMFSFMAPSNSLERVSSDASTIEPFVCIFEAALDGNTAMVIEAIESGSHSANDQNSAGRTALMLAAAEGNQEVLVTLVEKYHANIELKDKQGKTAIMLAAGVGRMDIVRLLREYSRA